MYWHTKSVILQMTLNFVYISSTVADILNQTLLTVLTFMALSLWGKMSICCRWFLFGVSCYVNIEFYTLKREQYITIWWAKFESEFLLLLIFIYTDSKSLQKCRLWMALHQNFITDKKHLKLPTLHLLFGIFLINILVLTTLESTFFSETIRCAPKWFILNQRCRI